MERAGTLSIPYGKQAAFAGRLGLTGCAAFSHKKTPVSHFGTTSGMTGKTKNADRSPLWKPSAHIPLYDTSQRRSAAAGKLSAVQFYCPRATETLVSQWFPRT